VIICIFTVEKFALFQLRCLWDRFQCDGSTQSGYQRSGLSKRLGRTLDWLQLCHGKLHFGKFIYCELQVLLYSVTNWHGEYHLWQSQSQFL